jgi:TolB-like protein/Flp pilus assembly protein TadD
MRKAARHSRASYSLRFADFEVDLRAGELRRDGVKIHLQEQPFQVLTVLLEQTGEVVSREELRHRLWPCDTFVDFDNSLNTAINKIREALGDSAEDPHFVETLPRRGYRFIAPVFGRVLKARSKTIDSLAVLPLVNATRLEETEYFSDGVTETIIASLAQLPRMRVMARSTVFRYKGREINPQAVGRELNVRAVITGRVLKRGGQISLGIELVDAEDGAQLWSASYNRALADIFAVQDQIATEISDKLRLQLTGKQRRQLTKRHTQNTEAYQLYLKGRFHLARRTEESFKKSLEYFQQAVEHDSDYALAYAGMADAYLIGQYYSAIAPSIALPKAKAAVARAIDLDESLAEVHATLGSILSFQEWDADAGEREFRRAIELNPNYSTGFSWYAVNHLMPLGRFSEAEATFERALKVDPFSLITNTHLGLLYTFIGKYDAAAKQFQHTLELDPNFAEAHFCCAMVCGCMGEMEEARAHVELALSLSKGDVRMRCALAALNAVTGRKQEAIEELKELLKLSETRYVSPYFLSRVYLGLGNVDDTFDWLEKAFQERTPHLRCVHLDPNFKVLRSHSRFQDLLRRMRLAAQLSALEGAS